MLTSAANLLYTNPRELDNRKLTELMILRRILVFAAVVALVLLTFHQLAFSGLILARGDTYAYFYPYWAARDAALSQGQLPLWTPDIFMGAPLLSDPQLGTFYPPNWLSALFGWQPPEAIKISILLHVIWATLGAYGLARFAGKVGILPAFISGLLFGLGGFVGAHVEQINQLQGLSWMPWAFLAYHLGFEKPLRYAPLLAMCLAMQVFSGHTQTVFITGLGLGIYGLSSVLLDIRSIGFPAPDDWRRVLALRFLRVVLVLVVAVILSAVLTLPQLIPTLELTGSSNRGGGFTPQQAMAFSWEPALAGRGLLPSYDAQVFGEYIAYLGVVGLGLALLGAFSDERRRAAWVIVALVGIFFAFGVYNPVYWQAASLPGFNLFRVPARWLALYTLGGSILAGLGAQQVIDVNKRLRLPSLWGAGIILIALAGTTVLAGSQQAYVDGPAVPTVLTWAAWGAALVVLGNLILLRSYMRHWMVAPALLVLVVIELYFASQIMPYNDLVDRTVYDDRRFTAYQLAAYDGCNDSGHPQDADAICPPGRLLSISNLYFDPGNKTAQEERYSALRMSERAVRYGLTAAKMKEVIAPNLPLAWDIPSIDGFGGGVLPTTYYTAFTSLLLPDGTPRTIDGRLRELLAEASCRGACIPQQRWLNLTDTRYLIVDKTFDPWQDGVAYDTTHSLYLTDNQTWDAPQLPNFTADQVRVLYSGTEAPIVVMDEAALPLLDASGEIDGMQLARLSADAPTRPEIISIRAVGDINIHAVTLVDTRTGDFAQVTLDGWEMALSSDIKLYENAAASRAFMVYDVTFAADSWDGTEQALTMMRDTAFDPMQQAIIAREGAEAQITSGEAGENTVQIVRYEPTRVEISVTTSEPGYLILSDAYFPGWRATVNGEAAEIYRADVMFRAVELSAGTHTVIFEYAPLWLRWMAILGVVCWAATAAITSAIWNQRISALEARIR